MLNAYLIYIAVASALTLLLYGADKLFAKTGARRIPERTLFFSSFIGGALGGLFGMLIFRHKTRKPRFFAINIVALVLHVALAVALAAFG